MRVKRQREGEEERNCGRQANKRAVCFKPLFFLQNMCGQLRGTVFIYVAPFLEQATPENRYCRVLHNDLLGDQVGN